MYLVIETYTENEWHPAYDYHEPPGGSFRFVERTTVHKFFDQDNLLDFLSKPKVGSKYTCYEAEQFEVVYKPEIKYVHTCSTSGSYN